MVQSLLFRIGVVTWPCVGQNDEKFAGVSPRGSRPSFDQVFTSLNSSKKLERCLALKAWKADAHIRRCVAQRILAQQTLIKFLRHKTRQKSYKFKDWKFMKTSGLWKADACRRCVAQRLLVLRFLAQLTLIGYLLRHENWKERTENWNNLVEVNL